MGSKEHQSAQIDAREANEEENCETVEHASDIIGAWGPYQLRIFLTLSVLYLVSPFHNKALVYYAPRIGFWCKRPEGYENVSQETCNSYENSSLACSEWEYDFSFYKSNIIEQYNLVCEHAWLVSMVQSCFQIGYLISSVVVGLFSDRFGRLKALKLCLVVEILTGILLIFAPNIYFFGVLRIIAGTAAFGRYLSSYLLILECVGPHLRARTAAYSEFGWNIGCMVQPGIYYLVREYKQMQLWITGFEIVMCFLIWRLDESIRWQLTNGKFDQAREAILRAAAEKGELTAFQVESKLFLLKRFLDKDEELRKKEQKETLLDVYRTPKLLKYCLILYFAWFVMTLVAYGISLNIGDLGGSLFLNSFVIAVASTVSQIGLIPIVDRFRRKRLLCFSYLGAAVSYVAMACVTSMDAVYMTSLAFLGTFFMSSVVILNYLYSTEIFPTTVRHIGIGSCSVISRIGSIAAPFARELTQLTSLSASLSIYGGLTLIAGCLVCFLPETQGKEIPDLISESTRDTISPLNGAGDENGEEDDAEHLGSNATQSTSAIKYTPSC